MLCYTSKFYLLIFGTFSSPCLAIIYQPFLNLKEVQEVQGPDEIWYNPPFSYPVSYQFDSWTGDF